MSSTAPNRLFERWRIRTLYGRIALVVILAVNFAIIALSLCHFWIGPRIRAESEQRLRWGIAADLVNILESVAGKGVADYSAAELAAHRYLFFNPADEIYFVDEHGAILGTFGLQRQYTGKVLDIEVVKAFVADPLRTEGPYFLPLDERASSLAAFSAAPLRIRDSDAYLVVMFGGSAIDMMSRVLMENVGTQLALVAALIVSIAATAGCLLVLGGIFARFGELVNGARSLRKEVRPLSLRAGNDDELGELAAAMNEMSVAITGHVGELRNRDALRRELIANIWHDLKAPVAALKGYLDVRHHRGGTDDGENDLVTAFETGLQHLSRMLNELHELSRLEAREVRPSFEPVALDELAEDVVLTLRGRAQAGGIELRCHSEGVVPAVDADSVMITRVLHNLIDNAIRYTPEGGSVTLSVRPSEAGVDLEVADTGRGIDDLDLPKLFERNFQGHADTPDLRGAQGLGLAIVKRILELHETEISVVTVRGAGTSFRFSLPIRSSDRTIPADERARELP